MIIMNTIHGGFVSPSPFFYQPFADMDPFERLAAHVGIALFPKCD